MRASFEDILWSVVLIEVFEVESLFDVVVKVALVGNRRVDIFLRDTTILDSLFVETAEEDTSGDILPSDVFDCDEINAGFDQECLDVRGLDVINQVLLERIHEILETTLLLKSFGGPIKYNPQFFDIKVFFGTIRLGDLEGTFFKFANETLMPFLAFGLAFLAVENIGFGQFKMIGFDQLTFDDILNIFDGGEAIDKDFRIDSFNIFDHFIRDVRDKGFVSDSDSVTGEFNSAFDTGAIKRNDFSIATADFLYGHTFCFARGARLRMNGLFSHHALGHQSFFDDGPVDNFRECFYIVSPFDAVVSDVGVFPAVHHEERCGIKDVSFVVIANPSMKEFSGDVVFDEHHPADTPHQAEFGKALFPSGYTPPGSDYLLTKRRGL